MLSRWGDVTGSRTAASGLAHLLVVVLLAAAGVTLAPTADASGGAFVSMINAARSSAGLPALAHRSDLASVAASWSAQMAASGTLAHNPRLSSQVSGYRFVGENVGYGPDAATIHRAFLDSPAHRANVLDRDYTEVGVAVVRAGDRLWVTEVFRAPSGSPVPSAPQHPAPARTTPPRPPPPSPEQLLRARAKGAVARAGATPATDPVQRALRFAAVMRAAHG